MERIQEINQGFRFIEASIKKLEKVRISESSLKLTQRELVYIVMVNDNADKTLTDIVAKTSVTKATLSNQIKTLVRKGFVELYSDKDDSRKKRVKLTKSGKDAYTLYKEVRREIKEEYVNVLTSDEIDSLIAVGRKIIAHIKGE